MSEDAGSQAEYQMLYGARVALPLDMDDLLLKSCIELAKEQLDKMRSGDWDKEGEAVTQGQRLMAMDEIGADPAAYRAKVEAELRAQLAASPQSQQPNTPALPQSLAGESQTKHDDARYRHN